MGASTRKIIGNGIIEGGAPYVPPVLPDVLYLVYNNAGDFLTLEPYPGIRINNVQLYHLVTGNPPGAPWGLGGDVWLLWENDFGTIAWRVLDTSGDVCEFLFVVPYDGMLRPLAGPVGAYTCSGDTCPYVGQNTYVTDVHP